MSNLFRAQTETLTDGSKIHNVEVDDNEQSVVFYALDAAQAALVAADLNAVLAAHNRSA